MRVHVNIPQLAESAFRMRQCEEAFQSTKQKMMEAVNAVLKTDLPEYQEFHEMTQTSGCEKFEALAQDCEIWAQAFMDIHDILLLPNRELRDGDPGRGKHEIESITKDMKG